jgi:hypothetical protein
MSTQALYENGYKSYAAKDWVYASVYLYAYIQRTPLEFVDTKYREEVITAYNYCVLQLNNQSQEYKKLMPLEESRTKDIIGSIIQELVKRSTNSKRSITDTCGYSIESYFRQPEDNSKAGIQKILMKQFLI